ncbi:hypothetical protein [Paraburkholderia sp. J41]|uniref:hypothetical protein n=1 Tax=Paraburkholderia sp. J41 TaxID=2805433 RepID=UPI002AC36D42|nr:hypothetical protein [Paraburkholderia sp. J41]
MRQAFNVGVCIVLALLLANRALTRVQAHEAGSLTCAQGSALVKAKALLHGFGEHGASAQGDTFLSSCLVSGQGQVGDQIAHD